MRLKSYFAATVEGALNMARQELGPDAMLVDSRRTGMDAKHLGEYEVVCAVFPPKAAAAAEDSPAASPSAVATGSAGGFRAPSLDKLSQDVSELKRYMERMASTIARTGPGLANLRANPELAELLGILQSSEVDASLAQDLVTRVADAMTEGSDPRAIMARELEKVIRTDSRLGRVGSGQAVVALVGPPGAGKTTCLVKLAARFGLATRRPTHIITLDTYRVAAAEQLRSYAAILGLGFQIADTAVALGQSLEECRHKDLILIDTPGFSRHDMHEAREMARFMATHPEIDTHLVLPASAKAADLKKAADSYQCFLPSKLLFTKLDETGTFGPILSLMNRLQKPVSFFSYGQQIPEDFEAAEKGTLMELILRRETLEENLDSAVAAA